MKWLISLLAIAALSGCVAYVPDRYDTGVYYGSGYRYSGDRYYGGRHYGGRTYRDWDGDGVPNRYDRAPNDPRRY